MNFYLNESYLVKNLNEIKESLKEIREINEFLKGKNYKLYVKYNLDFDYNKIMTNKEIIIAAQYLNRLPHLKPEFDMLELYEITPQLDNYYFLELMSLCYRDRNELILSSKNENEVIYNKYIIEKRKEKLNINNIIGIDELKDYCYHNPVPESVNEVFEKVEREFEHIKFTDKAYNTAQKRSDILKQYGFNNFFDIFKCIEKYIYPFYKGSLKVSQAQMIQIFKEKTGLEYSEETDATMNKYGYLREVTIDGERIQMRKHIKIKNDVRIYFQYIKDKDCIYIGHSGEHLRVAKKN